jgi:hypothetical protein
VHFDGFHVAVYFAKFPAEYLRLIRDIDLNVLENRKERVKLNHTRCYNLFNRVDRTDFIKEFVALLRYIAAGEANIGFLGKECKECKEINRVKNEKDELRGDEVLRPPQEEMDKTEERMWRMVDAGEYTF